MDPNYAKMLSHYRKVLDDCNRNNPFPVQTDEEKIAAQEGLMSLYEEMKTSRHRANAVLLEAESE